MFFFKKKKELKIWIYLDMEGINNITSWDEVSPGHPSYEKGQALMMDELNSCIKGAFDGGVDEIFLNDLHWFSDNVISSKLDKKVKYIKGLNLVLPEFFSKKFDAIFIIGMHSKVCTKDGILSHSWYLPTYIKEIKCNNMAIGEVDIINLLAEEKGVPVIFLSGDKTGCSEQKLCNNAVTAVTKECANGKILRMLRENANKLVYEKAKKSIELFNSGAFEKKQNFCNFPVRIKFGNNALADTILSRAKVKKIKSERIDDETLEFSGDVFSEILSNIFSVLD